MPFAAQLLCVGDGEINLSQDGRWILAIGLKVSKRRASIKDADKFKVIVRPFSRIYNAISKSIRCKIVA